MLAKKRQFYRATDYALNGLKFFHNIKTMRKPLIRNVKIVNKFVGEIFADELENVRNHCKRNPNDRFKGQLLDNYLAQRLKYKYLSKIKSSDVKLNLHKFVMPIMRRLQIFSSLLSY